jgi:hypothetical protein
MNIIITNTNLVQQIGHLFFLNLNKYAKNNPNEPITLKIDITIQARYTLAVSGKAGEMSPATLEANNTMVHSKIIILFLQHCSFFLFIECAILPILYTLMKHIL